MKSESRKVLGGGIIALSMFMLTGFMPVEAASTASGVQSEAYLESEASAESVIELDDVIASVEAIKEEQISHPWYKRAMANSEEPRNVYTEANAETPPVGVLYKGNAVDVLEKGDTWTKIRSGAVEGYIETGFLAFEDQAAEVAERDSNKIGTITSDSVRLRVAPANDQKVARYANAGNLFRVIEVLDGWVKVEDSGREIYVSAEYITIESSLGVAKTTQQIAEEEAARVAAEEAAKKAAEEAATKKAAEQTRKKSATSASSSAVSASHSDLQLLAAIIECEAGGESYEGKVAVGAVVLNRVRSSKFPNSISSVIYQRGQFSPVASGKLSRVLARGANSSCVQAAQAALNGSNNVGGALYFRSSGTKRGIVIGNHCFY